VPDACSNISPWYISTVTAVRASPAWWNGSRFGGSLAMATVSVPPRRAAGSAGP
jgi:hypothetical protein